MIWFLQETTHYSDFLYLLIYSRANRLIQTNCLRWLVRLSINTAYIYIYIYTHTHIYKYIYIYIYIYILKVIFLWYNDTYLQTEIHLHTRHRNWADENENFSRATAARKNKLLATSSFILNLERLKLFFLDF